MRISGTFLLALGLCTLPRLTELAAQETPGPRYGHEMVFDEARKMTLLFGGFGSDGVPKGDTWG